LEYFGTEVSVDTAKEVKEKPGEGLVGLYEGKALYVGNHRLMERYHIEMEATEFVGSVVYVAHELGIDTAYSELLPQDKLTHVEALINNNQKVLFVGDGINDAPVLARANIGVAKGGVGSDAAIEAGDIILMTDEPDKLVEAQKIAKGTRKIVLQNIVFALGLKLFFLTLGAIGIATMYEAIFADVGVALIAVINSMRTMRI